MIFLPDEVKCYFFKSPSIVLRTINVSKIFSSSSPFPPLTHHSTHFILWGGWSDLNEIPYTWWIVSIYIFLNYMTKYSYSLLDFFSELDGSSKITRQQSKYKVKWILMNYSHAWIYKIIFIFTKKKIKFTVTWRRALKKLQ